MRVRPTFLVAPLLAGTLGLAACGGGGSESSYTKTFSSACDDLVAARKTIATDAQKIASSVSSKDQNAQAKAIAVPYGRLAGAFATAFDKLEGADAPSKWSDYQDNAKKTFKTNAATFRTAQDQFKPGTVAAFKQGIQTLAKTEDPPKAPQGLIDATSSCTATGVTGVNPTAAQGGTAQGGTATTPGATTTPGTVTVPGGSSGSGSSGSTSGGSSSGSGTSTSGG